MDKSKISLIIGMACTMVGAFVINKGFGFIVTGIWAFIASFVESLKQDEHEEPKAPVWEIWHDIEGLKPPKKDGVLILRSPENSLEETIVGYWSLSVDMLKDQNGVFYHWYDLDKAYVFDKWCYLEDLIEKRN